MMTLTSLDPPLATAVVGKFVAVIFILAKIDIFKNSLTATCG